MSDVLSLECACAGVADGHASCNVRAWMQRRRVQGVLMCLPVCVCVLACVCDRAFVRLCAGLCRLLADYRAARRPAMGRLAAVSLSDLRAGQRNLLCRGRPVDVVCFHDLMLPCSILPCSHPLILSTSRALILVRFHNPRSLTPTL